MTTKTIKTIMFASLIVAMILPFTGMNLAQAEKKTDEDRALEKVAKYEYKFQKQLSKADQDKIHEKIIKDKNLSKDLEGKSIKRIGYSYTFNIYELEANPDKPVDIIMHYTVDNESLTVVVDGTTEKITDYEFTELGPALLPTNGLIISHYGGSAIKGLRMDYNAPNYSHVTGWSAMLVNAGMVGATSANACDPTKVTTSYWSQTGVVMNAVGRQLVWSDNTTSCQATTFTTSQTNPTAGQSIVSQITVNPSNGMWYMTVVNVSTGQTYNHGQSVPGTTNFQTNSQLTSVFFENPNTTTSNWNTGYTTNPKINKAYAQSTTNGVWNYWGSQTNYVMNCVPGGLNWSGYASGTLSGAGVTYNVNTIKTNCARA
jgi:hypothetical protein